MLDYCECDNNEHRHHNKTPDEYSNAKSLDEGCRAAGASGCATRKSKHERASNQRRYRQGEEKPTETNAAPHRRGNPNDES